MKKCSRCHIVLPHEQFYPNARYSDGFESWCKPCRREYQRDSKRSRKWFLKKKFKMTLEDFEKMIEAQNNLCAICRQPESRVNGGSMHNADKVRSLSVDHNRNCCNADYSCGECIRGLLCSSCNTEIGLLGDNIEVVKKLLEYLERYSGNTYEYHHH